MRIRTLIYNAIFILMTIVVAIVGLPLIVMGRKPVRFVIKLWSVVAMKLHTVITGIRHEYRGFERIPAGGAIIAIKHQSTWETIALVSKFADPCFIMKRELLRIPFVGWWLSAAGMIPIDRGKGGAVMKALQQRCKEELARGRQILIFPEGTRSTAGAPPDYKYGTAILYRFLGVPVVPIALNSGCAWPRQSWHHRRGTIVAEVLEEIPAGLDANTAFETMKTLIETGSNRLLLEAFERGDDLPDLARQTAERLALERDAVNAP